MPTGSEIREMFLRYFEQQGHTRVHSSSLVPANDPTLLFTNAGMNQFKDVFLGLEKRRYTRACSSQKCVRAGGKHNDLENVGFTNRHHTFFEMLGNFSFGDYFKGVAIVFAWELLTSKKWYGIPADKLYCTIFKGEGGVGRDNEAYQYWLDQKVPKERIFEFGMKDNFWQMGETGPCGPCSEVHYDMGPAASDLGHKDCAFGCDCGRYVELWNLVFMQFDRDAAGKLTPLPKPCVDTGAGLERVTAVLQGKVSNYDTDLFQPLIQRAAELAGVDLKKELEKEARSKQAASLRVIADHARATTFLISDGVVPSNEGRGYVLRKIVRRGIRHGRLLGQDKPFMHEMVNAVRDLMQNAYPDLSESASRVSKVVQEEERRFAHVVDAALKRLEEHFAEARILPIPALEELIESHERELGQSLAGAEAGLTATIKRLKERVLKARSRKEKIAVANQFIETIREAVREVFPSAKLPAEFPTATEIVDSMSTVMPKFPGKEAFKLYETYGLPLDFMEDAARDAGIEFDRAGFDRELRNEQERARASWRGGTKQAASPIYQNLGATLFLGYGELKVPDCEIIAIVYKGAGVVSLLPNQAGEVVLDKTPFYAEAGGQVGDLGGLYDGNRIVAEVAGCYMPIQGVRAHKVIAKDSLHVGQRLVAIVDAGIREHTMRNHTATHLLHAALRETLGKHVKQAGSLVAPDHLRFDFSHFTSVADEEMRDIEDLMNKEVLRNTKVEVIPDVPIDVAVNEYKAMALFGEKYGDKVRVIRIGDFSTELCGGTHTGATGEIGLVKILHEGSVSSGVRRVEAVSGEGSVKHFRQDHELESMVTGLVGRAASSSGASQSPAEVLKLELEKKESEIKRLTKELDRARMKSASASVAASDDQVRVVAGVKVLAQRVENLDRSQMRALVDNLRQKLGSGVVVLGSAADGKVSLIVGVTKDLAERVPAGKIIGPVAKKVGGSGGGRPDLAEAGGKDPEALDAALAEVYSVVQSLLK